MGVPVRYPTRLARSGVMLCSAILFISLFVASSVAAESNTEATWVKAGPGNWQLQDENGVLHDVEPIPGVSLHPAHDRIVIVTYSDSSTGWLISSEVIIPPAEIPTTSPGNSDGSGEGSGSNSGSDSTPSISLDLIPTSFLAPIAGIFGALLLTLGLAYTADEPTRKRVTEAVGRFGELSITEGPGTLAGNYQRGRIIGFLTAHPGCHLSALIRALELGNHQAVHHLRILEQSGTVWCRRDGRLLRYYTDKVRREAELSNLPRPIDVHQLSDVSLMLLREIAEQLPNAKSPSQRELAAKLETSQQLISHHLRRLENQGLISRERNGLRTRRVLTEEGQRIWAKLAVPA